MQLSLLAAEAGEWERAGLTNGRLKEERESQRESEKLRMVDKDARQVRNWGATWLSWRLAVRGKWPRYNEEKPRGGHTQACSPGKAFSPKHIRKKAANDFIIEAT